jgi:hypothetical protein
MYGLSENTDVSFFEKKVLLQVCIGFHEVILRFDPDISITAQTDIGHFSGDLCLGIYKSPVGAGPMLVRFLECTVVKAFAELPGTLGLEFSNGEGIEIYDSSPTYESYQIVHGGKIIVV